MYLHGLPVTSIDPSVAEVSAALTATGDIYLEDRNREFSHKMLPHLFYQVHGHTIVTSAALAITWLLSRALL